MSRGGTYIIGQTRHAHKPHILIQCTDHNNRRLLYTIELIPFAHRVRSSHSATMKTARLRFLCNVSADVYRTTALYARLPWRSTLTDTSVSLRSRVGLIALWLCLCRQQQEAILEPPPELAQVLVSQGLRSVLVLELHQV